jgi:pimeloyl-ACP methyl ester carboxylesterase
VFVRALRALVLVLGIGCLALAGTPAETRAQAERVRVVFVGGLGSSPATNALTFGPLARELGARAGYGQNDLLTFDYADGNTCQPLAASANQLAEMVRQLRDSGAADSVVLVGHSMGGVVALDAASALNGRGELAQPFIRRVITVDSPLGGLTRFQRAVIADLWLGPCPAANDSVQRYVNPSWPSMLSGRVASLLERGVQVFAVANPEDLLLDPWTQHVPELAAPNGGDASARATATVNVTLSALDDSASHSAVLLAPHGVAELVRLVGAVAGADVLG